MKAGKPCFVVLFQQKSSYIFSDPRTKRAASQLVLPYCRTELAIQVLHQRRANLVDNVVTV